jgi:uncharacterized phage protein (TIGR02220 family)
MRSLIKTIGPFDLTEFIAAVNVDYDNLTGEEVERSRVKLLNNKELWLTGFVQYQYKSKETGKVNPNGNFAKSAIAILRGRGLLNEAIQKGYLTLTEPLERDRDAIPKGEVQGQGKGQGLEFERGGEGEKTLPDPPSAITQAYAIDLDVDSVIESFNNICSTQYKTSDRVVRELIKDRMKDGFSIEEMEAVITLKEIQTKQENKRGDPVFNREHLTPHTLFHESKFSKYLEHARQIHNGDASLTVHESRRELLLRKTAGTR